MSESFAALFEESLTRTEMRPGEVITAEVVRIEHNFVVVNAGLKSESYVPLEEFKNDQGEVEVQVGDFVSVAIGSIENGYGDKVADLDFDFTLVVLELFEGHVGLGLETGVDDHEVVFDAHHFSGDDFTRAHFGTLQGFLKEGGKRFRHVISSSTSAELTSATCVVSRS